MRLPPLTPDQMTVDQRRVYDEAAAGRRGYAPAPLMPWLLSPTMAMNAQRLGESIRYDMALPHRLMAILALTVAVHWRAAYVRSVQIAKCLEQGVPKPVVDAIDAGQSPPFDNPADATVHAITRALLDRHDLDDDAYAKAVTLLGEAGVVELIAAFGYYSFVASTVGIFRIPAP